MPTPQLKLKEFNFAELFTAKGLLRLDKTFRDYLAAQNADLYRRFLIYREQTQPNISAPALSELLIQAAKVLENFLAELFQIQEPLAISQIKTISNNPVAAFKKYFVLRRAKKELNKAENLPSFDEITTWLQGELNQSAFAASDPELAVALLGNGYLEHPEINKDKIDRLVNWCVAALTTQAGQQYTKNWTSFRIPQRLDYANLIPTVSIPSDSLQRIAAPAENLRLRDGFTLTDPRMHMREVQEEVNYCIYCHDHEGDFCSKGFPTKKSDPTQGLKKNPLDLVMTGCPLDEKISEMHLLKKSGHTLAALSMVMIDNPMCPATGHRICNDCMKACIYQKQEPVNIPQIETRVLTDVLDLPWGVEIYDLLTRWNPLRPEQWAMKSYNGCKVMVAGMGPAGFTLAHHLLLEGFAVVGIDGLKIEPLPQQLIQEPIYHFDDLKESLDERLMAGFGGVAEYGITVRWDKNFLKLIYLSLMRKPYFQVFGGVRFGGTIRVEDAWDLGFDHFVIAVGAGLPRALPIPNSMATGMRQANDFLMALQLGNAAKASSLTSLQVRLPAVVIGGGLTGVDAATELQAYYIAQVEKIFTRYQQLKKHYGQANILKQLDVSAQEILDEYLRHALLIQQERAQAKTENRLPNFIKLIHAWGGVTIAYRRSMQESPAYINNHEELRQALQEGVYFLEGVEPVAVNLNEYNHCEKLICHKRVRNEQNQWVASSEIVELPAHTILVATGTQPNTAYEFEHKGTFNRINLQYQHYEESNGELSIAPGIEHCKQADFGPFTSYQQYDKRVSLIGDTHPVFHGNVVKAIASGMRTYPKIVKLLSDKISTVPQDDYPDFAAHMNDLFKAKVVSINRKTKNIIELKIRAPIATKHFAPGQFYRIQNFETHAKILGNTLLQMEPLSSIAVACDQKQGLLTFLITEDNTATKLCSTLQVGEPISLMGPTGVRAKVPDSHETVLIIGNETSFSFVRSYGSILREKGNRVVYVSILEHSDQVYCQQALEAATDMIVWLNAKGPSIKPNRANDLTSSAPEFAHILCDYGAGKLFNKEPFIPLSDVDRIFIVGGPDLLRQFQTLRKEKLDHYLLKNPVVYGSVYGNMQCMLKGVCAQCLQWQINPETGLRTKAVFACSWQDQPLEIIDIDHLDARQMQNRLTDQISYLWLNYLFEQHQIPAV